MNYDEINSSLDKSMTSIKADSKKADLANSINQGITTIRAMREARLQHDRDLEMFELNKQAVKNKIAMDELDPNMDPALVQQKKKLSLAAMKVQESDLALKSGMLAYQQKPFEQKLAIMQPKMLQMAQVLNEETIKNPTLFGNLLIDVNMEEGTVGLKSRTADAAKTQMEMQKTAATIEKEQSIAQRYKIESARKLAANDAGVVDEEKFQTYLKQLGVNLGSAQGSGTGTPAWVPQGKENQYSQAKSAGYSDDEIKQYLGS
jgi:hypothetical protein